MYNEENKMMENVEQATENTVSMEELQKKLQAAEAENKKLKKNLSEAKKEAREAEEAAEAAKIDAELAQQEKEIAQKEVALLKKATAENQGKGETEKQLTPGQKQVQMERRIHQAMETAKKNTVKIKLPYIPGAKDNEVFVGVNGYRYQIQRGVEVEVPRFVAEALENSEKQKMHADATLRALQEKAEAGEKAKVL